MIKTMKENEVEIFLSFLPKYVEHLEKNPNSLLAKIYGVYTVKKQGTEDVNVMLMENTL